MLPAHVAGSVDITVTTPLGTSPTNASDQFTYPCNASVAGLGIIIDTGTHQPSVTCDPDSGNGAVKDGEGKQ